MMEEQTKTLIGPDEPIELFGRFYETLSKWKPQSLTFEEFYEQAQRIGRINVYSIDRKLLKKLAQEKGIKVNQAVTSPKTDNWLKRAALFFGLSLGALIAIHILIVVVRG